MNQITKYMNLERTLTLSLTFYLERNIWYSLINVRCENDAFAFSVFFQVIYVFEGFLNVIPEPFYAQRRIILVSSWYQ